MGLPSVTAGRILTGYKFKVIDLRYLLSATFKNLMQNQGLAGTGEEYVTNMEDLDYTGMVKTYKLCSKLIFKNKHNNKF